MSDKKAFEQHRAQLRQHCKPLAGHVPQHPAEEFERVAAWCREQELAPDVYGEGEFLQGFEGQVAELLGFEAARFMPSGTMAQCIALRVWSDRSGLPQVGMHPTSHLELHEQRGYANLHQLKASLLGSTLSPMLADDLRRHAGRLSALLIELPTRENGGQLPTWEQHVELLDLARRSEIRLHLDGARLWEAQAAFERPFAEICAGFDSAYVSFYKGIGALPGSMLLGPRDFIEEAKVWQRRQGGNLYSSLANAASAAMRLESQLARMPLYRARALEVAGLLAPLSGLHILPDPPQTNMFHLFFDAEPERLLAARDAVAKETELWLIGGARPGDRPKTARTEISIYEAALAIEDEELVAAFTRMLELAR